MSYSQLNYECKELTNRLNFPRKIFIIPILIGTLVLLLNFQWMKLYLLQNAPVGDSLVYMTEAFNDFWLIRSGGVSELFNKYYLVGNQTNSPLFSIFAVISFLLFGLEPANAYLVVGLSYLAWITGVMYLAWTIRQDRQFAIACGLLAAFLPSTGTFALRHFMLDSVAAAPFIWSTAFLMKSDLLNNRRDVLAYALLVSITVLIRSTAFMYFFSHVGIIALQVILTKRQLNYRNLLLAAIIILIVTGTFIFPNLSRILGYYGYWGQQANLNPVKNLYLDNFLFYLRQLNSFHMLRPGFAIYSLVTLLGIFEIIRRNIQKKWIPGSEFNILLPISIFLILVIIPTVFLSMYSSRAATVDFIFIGAYLFFPVIIWRKIFPTSKLFWIPIVIVLLSFARTEVKLLIEGNANDYREREVLSSILLDAQRRGRNEIVLGNTAIHQHNSLSYQYWILANYFPHWTNKVKLVAVGRTDSAEELAKMNSQADYIVALDNYKADWHPNNVVAPEANRVLQDKYGMVMMPYKFELPDGVVAKVLTRQTNVTFPAPFTDGWHEDGVKIIIQNPLKKPINLKIAGELMIIKPDSIEVNVTLQSKLDPKNKLTFVNVSGAINHVFNIPATFFNGNAVEFSLINSLAGTPSSISNSKDGRNLAFRNLSVKIESF